MQRNWCLSVANKKWLRTPFGMIFYWPDTKVDRSGYITNSTAIHNYPVQSGATAEIIPIALVHFWYRSEGLDIEIVNTIHDSIVSEVAPHAKEVYEAIAIQAMTGDVFEYLKRVYGYEFECPLGVGNKMAEYWSEGEEVTYNVFPDGTIKKKD